MSCCPLVNGDFRRLQHYSSHHFQDFSGQGTVLFAGDLVVIVRKAHDNVLYRTCFAEQPTPSRNGGCLG